MTKKSGDHHSSTAAPYLYKLLGVSAIALIVAGTVTFSALEGWSIVDSLYFSLVTTTTVGFGDLTPGTDAAKLVTVVYILGGISIVGTCLDARLKRHILARTSQIEQAGESAG